MSVIYLNTNQELNTPEICDKITGWSCGCIGCLNNIYELPPMFNPEYWWGFEELDTDYSKFIKKHNRHGISN